MSQANIDKALQLTNDLLFEAGDAPLNKNEIAVIVGTWKKETYDDMAVDAEDADSDKLRACGSRLWRRLTKAFGVKEVNKNNFADIVRSRLSKLADEATSEQAISHLSVYSDFKTLLGNPPSITSFVGREPEIAMLMAAIKSSQCVSLTGPPGIGKSSLTAKIVNLCAEQQKELGFVACIWKSLSYKPNLTTLLGELLSIFDSKDQAGKDTYQLMGELFSYLNKHRILVVLDSVESLKTEGNRMNPWGRHTDYHAFINRVIEEQHSSCFILCSQEPIREVKQMENSGFSCRAYVIEGLGKDTNELLRQTGLGHERSWKQLISDYQGNPYALLAVAHRVIEFFDGDLPAFLALKTTCVEDDYFQAVLDQISRLTELEQNILDALVKTDDNNTTFSTLRTLFPDKSITSLMTAVDRLEDRSLIQKTDKQPFTLSSSRLVKKVISLRTELGFNDTSPSEPVTI